LEQQAVSAESGTYLGHLAPSHLAPRVWPVEELREAPVSGHIFRKKRQSGDRWMAKWRDAAGQHQRVMGKAWMGRGRPPEGYLTKRGAQEVLDTILADARRGRLVARRPESTVTFADAAEEWLRYLEHERGRRASTLRNYRLPLRNHILPALRRQGDQVVAPGSTGRRVKAV